MLPLPMLSPNAGTGGSIDNGSAAGGLIAGDGGGGGGAFSNGSDGARPGLGGKAGVTSGGAGGIFGNGNSTFNGGFGFGGEGVPAIGGGGGGGYSGGSTNIGGGGIFTSNKLISLYFQAHYSQLVKQGYNIGYFCRTFNGDSGKVVVRTKNRRL